MTLEEIIERNVKIAKFVGFTPTYPNLADCGIFRYQKLFPKFDQALYVTEVTSTGRNGRFKVKNITQWVKRDEFEFHFNMGWLMPVLEKIVQENDDVIIDICVGDETTFYNKDRTGGSVFKQTGTLDNTWRACVYFIQKQNENSSSLQS